MPLKNVVHTSSSGRVQYSLSKSKVRNTEEIERDRGEYETEDHSIALNDLYAKLRTNGDSGLTVDEADYRLKKYGPNCLVTAETTSKWVVFVRNVFGGFSTLLWIGAILCFVGYGIAHYSDPNVGIDKLYMGIILLVIVSVTGLFGFVQEVKSLKVIEGFNKITPKTAIVIRERKEIVLPSAELVVGDIIKLVAGNAVPADIRVIRAIDLEVECSSLTGESRPVKKSPDFTDQNPMETENLAFFGTFVVQGEGKGVVIACGNNTAMGRIAFLTTGIEAQETNLTKDLKKFVHIITILALIIGVTFFIASLMLGNSIFQSLLFLIAMAVANMPESLLITMSACLTLTAQQMKSKNCAIKNLQAIETLGSTSVICSDKTGTLTENKMAVSHVFVDGIVHDVLLSNTSLNMKSEGLAALCLIAELCNRAEFIPGQENVPLERREVIGDATETAILKFVENITGKVKQVQQIKRKIYEVPFNSSLKYQLSIHEHKADKLILVLKGAPENILRFCSTYYDGTENIPLTDGIKKIINGTVVSLGTMGERVLGFCDAFLPHDKYPVNFEFNRQNIPLKDLRFVGLMSMVDPPRSAVPGAVVKCKSAGIKVVMVTGDHPVTAESIARKVGIISTYMEGEAETTSVIITGTQLRQMDTQELTNLVNSYDEIVFARTSPQQKLRIVEAFQENGHIVAVTGDGVNDAPALKKGNIGIAMGLTGTDVAKEAADMILLDDDFSSIVYGIEEGRLIFDNLKKSIAFLLTSNVPECVPFVLFIILGIPQSLSIIAILAIDVGTDLWPSITIAYEKAEADIMRRKPRNYKIDKLVTWKLILYAYLQVGVLQTFATMSAFFIMMSSHGWHIRHLINIREKWEDPELNDLQDSYGVEWTYEERRFLEEKGYSVSFLAMAVTQLIDLVACKTRRLSVFQQGMNNWCMNASMVFEILFACVLVYTPHAQSITKFAFVEWYFVLPAVPFGILIIVYDEIRKKAIRNNPGGWADRELYY